ncbi:TPA: recombinase family protein [Clostridium botulinum]|uniref:recombinase family protein n=1 Tax=Clostridium TaxID=1485 RepID=UPI000773541A|nr:MULTISPECIES: recombinase family protein [Clostridium]AUM94651.1 resolvase [Clostridium sporogenes]AVQ52087.1 recombinase family protein [Clostridium botulinum]HBJ2612241.1 recombinase family protein [Clostridium botulinum]
MLIGYARVSTQDQHLELQKDALEKAGCEKIFTDIASGAKTERKGLEEALTYLRKGDILVVWRLDRLGRSLKHLIEVVNDLSEKNIGFQSLQEKIDTTTSGGKLIFHIFASLAEFERDIIRERTNAGLKAARARGRIGGRPRVMDNKKISMAKALVNDPNNSIKDICETLNVSKATLYRYLKQSNESQTNLK